MQKKETIKADLKQATKIGCANKNMTMGELARKTGREGNTLSEILRRGRPSLENAIEILKGAGGTVMVKFDNGQEVELIVE